MTFSGCNNEPSGSKPESENSVSVPESTVGNSVSSSDINSANTDKDHSESTSNNEDTLSALIRYARPFFRTTLSISEFDSGAFDDYEELSNFLREGSEQFPAADLTTDFFEVKTGDKLENNLTVTVETSPFEGYRLIKLDGELTMEGVLYLETEDHDYIYKARDLMFYPNSIENPFIPTMGEEITTVVFSGLQGVSFDGNPYFLGNIDDTDINEQEIFGGNKIVKVKITVENIKIGVEDTVYDLSPRADIVSVEMID